MPDIVGLELHISGSHDFSYLHSVPMYYDIKHVIRTFGPCGLHFGGK